MKTSKPTLAELEDPSQFDVIADVAHSDVIPFVRQHLYHQSWVTTLYWLLNVAAVGVIYIFWRRSGLPILDAFPQVCLGMAAGYVLLLPIHEHLHGLAYRLVGARRVKVRYNPNRFTALCEAPGAVVSGGEFIFVCLTPIVLLNPLLAVLAFTLTKAKLALMSAGALLLHTGGCSGDVGLVNFVWQHRECRTFTVDDADQQRARFFRAC